MKFEAFLIPNTEGKKSLTATLLLIGFIVSLTKFALSGLTIHGFTFQIMTASDFAYVVGSLGGLYSIRRSPQLGGTSRTIITEQTRSESISTEDK